MKIQPAAIAQALVDSAQDPPREIVPGLPRIVVNPALPPDVIMLVQVNDRMEVVGDAIWSLLGKPNNKSEGA